MQVSRSEVAGQISGLSLSSPSSMGSLSLYNNKLQSKFCIPPASLNKICIRFGVIAKNLLKTIADCHTSKKLRKIFSVYEKPEEKREK